MRFQRRSNPKVSKEAMLKFLSVLTPEEKKEFWESLRKKRELKTKRHKILFPRGKKLLNKFIGSVPARTRR